ncbi:MAG: hypothetical protein LBG91_04395, partial [Treponema sp.]|nr:hypothetical protein [Treponema sp.]
MIVRKPIIAAALFCLFVSCTRFGGNQPVLTRPSPDNENVPLQAPPLAVPLAVLQPGEYPLWFQLTEDGPILLESMQDALFSAALVPWPLALHVRFFE